MDNYWNRFCDPNKVSRGGKQYPGKLDTLLICPSSSVIAYPVGTVIPLSSISFLNRPRELFMAVTFTETDGLFRFNDVSLFAIANISAHAVLVAVPDCDASF
jgi:hypothetical protein